MIKSAIIYLLIFGALSALAAPKGEDLEEQLNEIFLENRRTYDIEKEILAQETAFNIIFKEMRTVQKEIKPSQKLSIDLIRTDRTVK